MHATSLGLNSSFCPLVGKQRVNGAGHIVPIEVSDICAGLKRGYKIARIKLPIAVPITFVERCILSDAIFVLARLKDLD